MPFYQAGLGDRLEYELTFNDYNKVIKLTDEASSYTIKIICLECDMVSDPELIPQKGQQYSGKMVLLYDCILQHSKITKNKSDTLWNINLNVPARSMKGILMLFGDPDRTNTDQYYNSKIEKVEMIIEGVFNQQYSQCMRAYQQWDEIIKYFALSSKRGKVAYQVAKHLFFTERNHGKYITKHYALWLDLRTTDNNLLRGSGGALLNASTPASNLGYLAPPQDNFSWVPNCSLGPPGWETKVSSKKFWFGLCEIAWFLCQPIANLRRGVCL